MGWKFLLGLMSTSHIDEGGRVSGASLTQGSFLACKALETQRHFNPLKPVHSPEGVRKQTLGP